MTQATQPSTDSAEERPDDQALVSINKTVSAENYHDHDNRHEQQYWGDLVLNFPVMLDARALPQYSGEDGIWARDIWSKFPYMLGDVCSMARKMARLNMAGLAHPSEIGLDEDGESLDLPAEVPGEFDLAPEGNPITGEAYRPFGELEKLVLILGIEHSRYPEPDPDDDFHDLVIKLELRAEVERPSMIPSKTELRGAASRVSNHVFAPVRASLARALELARRRVSVRRNMHSTTQIARKWAKHFLSEASEAISYSERLEALRDELRDEVHESIEAYFEGASEEEIAKHMNVPVSVVRTAKRVWEDYLHIGGGLSPSTSNVAPKEVLKDLSE